MSQIVNQNFVNNTLINGVNVAVTVTPQMNGTTFICTKNAGLLTVTLPDPTIAGLRFRFVMAQAAVVAQIITLQTPTANTMAGLWISNAGAVTATANACATHNANFTATSEWGDIWDLTSDGTLWRGYGTTSVAAGCSFS